MLNLNYLDVGEIVRDLSEGGVELKGFAPLDHDECARKVNDTMTQKEVGELDHHHSLQDQEDGKGQMLSTKEETVEMTSKDNLNDPEFEKNAPKPPRQGGGTMTAEDTTLAPKVNTILLITCYCVKICNMCMKEDIEMNQMTS